MHHFTMSCTTCALRGNGDEVADTFLHAPAAGYRYWGTAGPALWTPFIGRWLDAGKMKAEAAKAGLLGCTEVYSPPIATGSEEAAVRSVEAIVAQAEFAVRLESPWLVLSGGDRTDGEAGLAHTVAGLEVLLARIRHLPVGIALEPHVGSRLQDAGDYAYILSRIRDPRLGITVDTGHFHAAGVDTRGFIGTYAERVVNVHVKDHQGSQSVPIGEGEIDLLGIFSDLMQGGYRGALALEIEPADTTRLPLYVKESHRHLVGILDRLHASYR